MDIYGSKPFRHELKHLISALDSEELKIRLLPLMKVDAHAGPGNCYHISSLYFDDYDNSGYYDNENGNDPREKFRIRFYNYSNDRITLENKSKVHGLTYKQSCPLTIEQTRTLMEGRCVPDFADQPPLLQKLTLQMQTRGLHPVIIVDYDRVPFVYRNGNVRVTFDYNISSCYAIDLFLSKKRPLRPIMPAGDQILEVKYDRFLPDEIYQTLQLDSIRQTAFSKYYLCRKFSDFNN